MPKDHGRSNNGGNSGRAFHPTHTPARSARPDKCPKGLAPDGSLCQAAPVSTIAALAASFAPGHECGGTSRQTPGRVQHECASPFAGSAIVPLSTPRLHFSAGAAPETSRGGGRSSRVCTRRSRPRLAHSATVMPTYPPIRVTGGDPDRGRDHALTGTHSRIARPAAAIPIVPNTPRDRFLTGAALIFRARPGGAVQRLVQPRSACPDHRLLAGATARMPLQGHSFGLTSRPGATFFSPQITQITQIGMPSMRHRPDAGAAEDTGLETGATTPVGSRRHTCAELGRSGGGGFEGCRHMPWMRQRAARAFAPARGFDPESSR